MRHPTDLPGVFDRAAEVVECNGLNQGSYYASAFDAGGLSPWAHTPVGLRPVCMAGAIHLACGVEPSQRPPQGVVLLAVHFASTHMEGEAPLSDGVPDYVGHLAEWNDLPSTSAAEVAARLRRLAIEARVESCAITCRYLDEHGDPCDWCQATREAYLAELAAAGLGVAA